MRILDLGCGRKKTPGTVGMDGSRNSRADILADLDRPPYPLQADVFDRVILNNVLEHLDDVVAVLGEVHRIARPGAEVVIRTPHFSSVYSWRDVTHRHHLALDSLDQFATGSKLDTFYTGAWFEILEKRILFGKSLISWIPRGLCRLSPHKYEKHLAFVFPANDLLFRLRVVK